MNYLTVFFTMAKMKGISKMRLKKIAQIYVGSLLMQEDELPSGGILGAEKEGELAEEIHRMGRKMLRGHKPMKNLEDVVKYVVGGCKGS